MAKKFSGFSTSIIPDKTSTSQFIVGYSGQDNAQWTMKALADEIGGGDNIYTADGDILAARTINDRAGGFTGTAGSNAIKMNVRNQGAIMVAGYENNGDSGQTNNCFRWGPGTAAGAMNVRGNLALSGGGGAINLTGSSGQFFTVTQTGTTINTNVGVGLASGVTSRLHVKGAGLTNATNALKVQDSGGTDLLSIADDGNVKLGKYSSGVWPFASDGANTQVTFAKTGTFKFNNSVGGNYIEISGSGNGFLMAFKSGGFQYLNYNSNGGQMGIGATGATGSSPQIVPSAQLAVTSSTRGFLPPRMTNTQRDAISSPDAGLMVYNNTDSKIQFYNGSAWTDAGGGGDSIYTASSNIPTATNRTVTLTGTATLAFYGAQNQGDFRIGYDQGSTSRGRSNYSIQQSGDQINTYCYQSNHYVNSNSDPLNSGYRAGTNYLSVSAQGLEHHKVSVGIGINGTMNDRLVVKGESIASAEHSVRVLDNNDASMFSIRNDGAITMGKGAVIQSTSNPQYSVVIGYGAKDKASVANGVEAIAIGRLAVGHQNGVAIGGQAACLGASAVAIGAQAQAAATGTSIGLQAGGASAGSSAVSIGKFAQAKANGSIAIGTNTGLTGANSIVLNATTGVTASTADDTFEIFMTSTSTPDFTIKGTSGGNQAKFVGQVSVGVGSGSNATIDFDTGNMQEITIPTETATSFTPTNAVAGSTYIIKITQAGTSGTMNWESSATVNWPGGTAPTLTATSGGVDIITLVCTTGGLTGGTFYGTSALNFS